jgi:serine phosphatase RsbU (regulator of sigma subunit)
VLEAVAEHQAGARQHDDITVLAARVGEATS